VQLDTEIRHALIPGVIFELTAADVRFFPLATRGRERYELDDQVEKALTSMLNLESLVWTVGHLSVLMHS
jgi:hypothetical protein